MRTICCLSVLFFLCQLTYAQQISGEIVEAGTLERLPFASVFINNTSYRTESDSAGRFELSRVPVGEYTLVVRRVGYVVQTQKLIVSSNSSLTLSLRLVPDRQQLGEVTVKAKKDKTWLRQLRRFKRQFLGEGEAAAACKLTNSWVLNFSEKDGKLTAIASDPLLIDNQYTGYAVTYLLNTFSYDGTQVSFSGYATFSDYFTTDKSQKMRWLSNRKQAYERSDIAFFRSLQNQRTQQDGYEGFVDKPVADPSRRSPYFYQNQLKTMIPVVLDSLVSADAASVTYSLRVPRRLEIHHATSQPVYSIYTDKPADVAWIDTKGRPLRFNRSGILLNPADCQLSGYLISGRMANLLPTDYQQIDEQKNKHTALTDSWTNRLEIPYFTTDRAYYTSRDLIQVSGVMTYTAPRYADSLSTIIHVELVDPTNRNVLVHQLVHVKNGQFVTQIRLMESTKPAAPYLLRAYTQWMRNFGDSCYAYRWIPVLLSAQRFAGISAVDSLFDNYFTIHKADSLVVLKPTDYLASHWRWGSVALVDEAFAMYNDRYGCISPTVRVSNATAVPVYSVQRGVDVRGRFRQKQGKNGSTVTIFSASHQRTFFADINSQGEFAFVNLPLTNKQLVVLSITDAKGRMIEAPTVEIDTTDSPTWIPPTPQLSRPIIARETTSLSDWEQDVIQMKEVVVKAPSPPKPIPTLYKSPDYTVSGKDLFDKTLGANILVALQGRVPGLRIVDYLDEQGVTKLIITMRGGSTVGGFVKGPLPQPLILVDGIPFDDVNQLSQLSVSQVDRIEVVNRAESLLGLRGYVGVISIITKNALAGSRLATPPSVDVVRIPVRGIHLSAEPMPAGPTRSWQPAVVAGQPIQINVPQRAGHYLLVVEGITNENVPLRLTKLLVR